MWGATVGFFGKLPSHGDFIERRVGPAFRDLWDDWMQRCMVESQRTLGGRWLDCYLTSPMWRFFLSDGVAGAASYAGVLLPSVDRVGRYFPMTVVVELPIEVPALEFARTAADWFGDVEQLCADALQNPDFEFAAFDAALEASAAKLSGMDQVPERRPFPARSSQWHWPCGSVSTFADAITAPLMSMAQGALRPMTMWWTDGSQLVHPSVLLTRSLPRPDSFGALLAGTWDDGNWDGEIAPAPASIADTLEIAVQYAVESAAATDVGMVREKNEDSFLLRDDNRLWAVADGMGGQNHGEIASRMVVDALNAIESASTLNTCLQSIATALQRVNSDLRRSALGVGGSEGGGSTVVALAIRRGEWGVSWAGDSRAYVYRAPSLVQLTRDHTAAADMSCASSATSEIVAPAKTETSSGSGTAAREEGDSDAAGLQEAAVSEAASRGVTSTGAGLAESGLGAATLGSINLAASSSRGVNEEPSDPNAVNIGVAGAGPSTAGAPPATLVAAIGEITRAVGGHDLLELDCVADVVIPGDRFLLCSDGLYTALDETSLIACLQKVSAQEASDALIAAARAAGARDNVTAVIVDLKAQTHDDREG
jgi:type VI secretion system protein ImpM